MKENFKINCNLMYTTKRVSCLAQAGFAAFGKGVQLISEFPFDETEQRSQLASLLDTS